jgi:glycosyltransferase involved in cell wall biosynthesis
MVLVESLAAGTPVVGADHGAIPELVDATVGATFTADDPEACARALDDVLGRDDDRELVTRCRARAASYDWSVVGPMVLDLYDRIA